LTLLEGLDGVFTLNVRKLKVKHAVNYLKVILNPVMDLLEERLLFM